MRLKAGVISNIKDKSLSPMAPIIKTSMGEGEAKKKNRSGVPNLGAKVTFWGCMVQYENYEIKLNSFISPSVPTYHLSHNNKL